MKKAVVEYINKLNKHDKGCRVIINCEAENWHIDTYADSFPYTEEVTNIGNREIVNTYHTTFIEDGERVQAIVIEV